MLGHSGMECEFVICCRLATTNTVTGVIFGTVMCGLHVIR